jgi:hypothetical protein
VKKFETGDHLILPAMQRIQKDPSKALNHTTISFLFNSGTLNQWEHDFYMDTFRKRVLSEKQRSVRVRLNEKALRVHLHPALPSTE